MSDPAARPVVAVLGASGLIGEALTSFLLSEGHRVVPMARRFTPVQAAAWAGIAVRAPLVGEEVSALRAGLAATGADIVVNCIGALQDAPGAPASDANRDFVTTLIEAMPEGALLVHVSIPGEAEGDVSEFSRGKRQAEASIAASDIPHVVLRPGFVVADAAYGGSALMRALAVTPFDLPKRLAERPFAVTDVRDIGRTVAFLIGERASGRTDRHETWDVMEAPASTVGAVLHGLRTRLAGPRHALPVPGWMLGAASLCGDLVSRLGWRPPVRSTALAEMRRGVTGDPSRWRAATGLTPLSGAATLGAIAATVQERWFARLYLLKALVIGILVPFWIVTGVFTLVFAFEAASRILIEHGFARPFAQAITAATSLMDIVVGALVAHRRTCRAGLYAGIALSVFYMVSAAVVTPVMWLDPLGSLVKTFPAIVLMMVGLAILDDR